MSEKKYPPTQKRLREARKQGEVVRSRDLSSFASFLALWVCFWVAASHLWKHVSRIMDHAALSADPATSGQPWQMQISSMLLDAAWVIFPLLGVSVVFAALVGGVQTRGMISFTPITPQFSRMNPGEGLRNLFTLRQLFELGKMLLKILLLLGMLVYFLVESLQILSHQVYAPAAAVLQTGGELIWRMMGLAAIIYLLTAIVDSGHQFYEFMKKHKMSIEELRQDLRDAEGDPRIKGRRRAIARELLFSPSLAAVSSSSVVIVNPTHFAVALKYQPGTTPLPKVVAKGVDTVALRMRELAERAGVPVLEDRPLARKLFREVQVGHYIKDEFVDAVAAVFRWLKLMEDRRQGSVQLGVAETESNAPHRVDQPGEVGPVDLATQSGDMHVNDIVERGGASHVFPNLVR
jgi:type III secretion protein U